MVPILAPAIPFAVLVGIVAEFKCPAGILVLLERSWLSHTSVAKVGPTTVVAHRSVLPIDRMSLIEEQRQCTSWSSSSCSAECGRLDQHIVGKVAEYRRQSPDLVAAWRLGPPSVVLGLDAKHAVQLAVKRPRSCPDCVPQQV